MDCPSKIVSPFPGREEHLSSLKTESQHQDEHVETDLDQTVLFPIIPLGFIITTQSVKVLKKKITTKFTLKICLTFSRIISQLIVLQESCVTLTQVNGSFCSTALNLVAFLFLGNWPIFYLITIQPYSGLVSPNNAPHHTH